MIVSPIIDPKLTRDLLQNPVVVPALSLGAQDIQSHQQARRQPISEIG